MKVATKIGKVPYNRRRPMERLLRNLFRGMGRIFPDCVTLGQAIAFNMFLAFFPILLLALGLLSSTSLFPAALKEIPERLSMILPPGSTDVVFAYFVRRTIHSWRWVSLGLGGTLIAGSQVMIGFMEGFRVIEGDLLRPKYLRRQLRARALVPDLDPDLGRYRHDGFRQADAGFTRSPKWFATACTCAGSCRLFRVRVFSGNERPHVGLPNWATRPSRIQSGAAGRGRRDIPLVGR